MSGEDWDAWNAARHAVINRLMRAIFGERGPRGPEPAHKNAGAEAPAKKGGQPAKRKDRR